MEKLMNRFRVDVSIVFFCNGFFLVNGVHVREFVVFYCVACVSVYSVVWSVQIIKWTRTHSMRVHCAIWIWLIVPIQSKIHSVCCAFGWIRFQSALCDKFCVHWTCVGVVVLLLLSVPFDFSHVHKYVYKRYISRLRLAFNIDISKSELVTKLQQQKENKNSTAAMPPPPPKFPFNGECCRKICELWKRKLAKMPAKSQC